VEIRIATTSDIEGLCPLLTEFFAYNAELQPIYCSAAAESGEYPKSMIESENSDFLVAVDNENIVGFIHINQMSTPAYDSIVPHEYAEIMAFMVTASYREQGVGTKLLDYAKDWSKSRNLEYIELLSLVNASEATEFYEKKDFYTVMQLRRYIL